MDSSSVMPLGALLFSHFTTTGSNTSQQCPICKKSLDLAATDELAENIEMWKLPHCGNHSTIIIHFRLYTIHLVLDLIDAASAPIRFDEIVVLRGNINCAFFRPNLVERLVPLARRFCIMCSAYYY